MLAAVWIDRKNKCNLPRTGLSHGINSDKEAHYMVVHAQGDFVFSIVQGNRLVVFHILKNKNVLPPDTFVKLALKLSIGEERKTCVQLELWRAVLVHHPPYAKVACMQIVVHVNLTDERLTVQTISLGDDITFQ